MRRSAFPLCASLIATAAAAQPPPSGTPFDRLQSAATRLSVQSASLNPPDGQLVKDVSNLTDELSRAWQNADKPKLSDELATSIDGDASDLQKVSAMRGDAPRTPILRGVRDDLSTKVKFVKSASFGAAASFRAAVDVTVETSRNGTTANGLWVRCNPARWGLDSTPQFPFNSATSPTMRRLPPGDFVMWVESASHEVLAQQPVQIGANGKAQETIRFAIP